MKKIPSLVTFLFIIFFFPAFGHCLEVGLGRSSITPPIGTPSAGYAERKGMGMQGVHDPLEARALLIDNGSKRIVLCGVDNLGFPYELIQKVVDKVHTSLPELEIYIGSSHTHSGGGAFLNIPVVGEMLAGKYQEEIAQFYINGMVKAILDADKNRKTAKIGIGYGHVKEGLSIFRSSWPSKDVKPLTNIAVIKVTDAEEKPLALIFNYAIHPTVLDKTNVLFSADLVSYARNHIEKLIGNQVQTIFINGAQGEIIPSILNSDDRFDACDQTGKFLAGSVEKIWGQIKVSDELKIKTFKEKYSFIPQPTPNGMTLPIKNYESEINLIILNDHHAFITVPGELSCLYDSYFKKKGIELGYHAVSIFGLVNDAHGYIIYPEAWRNKTFESSFSFGGEQYGDIVKGKIDRMLEEGIKNN
jgi:hypothetical protein